MDFEDFFVYIGLPILLLGLLVCGLLALIPPENQLITVENLTNHTTKTYTGSYQILSSGAIEIDKNGTVLILPPAEYKVMPNAQ